MKAKHITSWLRLGAVCTIACAGLLTAQADSSTIRVALQNTGLDPDAAGSILTRFKLSSSQLTLQASKLTPGQSYVLTVGDVPEATLKADNQGRVRATFVTKAKKNTLDFDPRGQLVALRDGTNSVLEAVVSGEGEPAGITVDESAKLNRIGGTGEATASYKALRSGQRAFAVKVENVAFGDWSVFVNGILRGMLSVHSRQSTLVFDSNPTKPGRLLLDFDPRGQVVDLGLGTNLMFTGTLEAKAKNVNVASPSLQLASIPSTGVDADGTAHARLRVDSEARRKFSVEIEDVPAGAYEFLANGIFQGNINVANIAGEFRGEIEFTSRDDDDQELPLTFDPTNSTFIIRQGAVVFFEGALTNDATGGGTNGGPAQLDESLTSTGLDADAHGDAKYETDDRGRHKFSVEIEDVAVGSYELWVAGTKRGNVNAALKNSKVKGELQFSDHHDVGELPLTFDPRGQLIEVKTAAAGVFFSHLFGLGSTNGGGTNNPVVVPVTLSVPLFNLGVSPGASAQAKFKRDDRGRRSFEVEIEDAPVGAYVLQVAGAPVATITVTTTANGNRGKIKFQDDNGGGNPALSFDPLGQIITLSRNGVDYFQRVFPPGN